jgi:uncharacterized damage-inducible protein DinB
MTPSELADAYLAGATQLRAAVSGMTRDQFAARPVPGKWSTLEVLAHLADFETVFLHRLQRVIAFDNPTVAGVDDKAFTAALHYEARDADEELSLIEATRRKGARLIRCLTPEQLNKPATHTDAGPLTLLWFIEKPINHINHHLPFIAEKRKALGLA